MLISSVYAAGVRQEQDLYIRLIDAATKQVGYATFSLLHNIIREIAWCLRVCESTSGRQNI